MDKKVRIGVVGCGGIANGKHMPNLAKIPEVEMVAFCDIIPERAEAAAKKFGTPDAKTYTDYKELIKDETIDVVHVCTPNRSHSFISIDAMEAGKHVMCEKPMAKTYAEAKAMYEASVRTGKLLSIGYQNRQCGENLYAKAVCDAGEIGEIYYAKAVAIRRRAVPTWGVFLNEYEQGGGPLIDIGTHALDLTLWMMNNYKPKMVVGNTFRKLANQTNTANAWGDWDPEKYTVEDSAFGFVVMENGATIALEASWALNSLEVREAKTLICGTKAGADMLDGLRVNGVDNGRLYTKEIDLGTGSVAYFSGNSGGTEAEREAYQWIWSLRNNTDPCVLPEQAYVVTQILEGMYESAKIGDAVHFNK